MCWKCDHPEATMQEWLELIYGKVQENGWTVQFVQDDRTPFAYTIGLPERGLPELLVTGMPPERANLVLNTVAQYLLQGGRPIPGERMLIGGELLLDFVQVQHPIAHLKFAFSFYGPICGPCSWSGRTNTGTGRGAAHSVTAGCGSRCSAFESTHRTRQIDTSATTRRNLSR